MRQTFSVVKNGTNYVRKFSDNLVPVQNRQCKDTQSKPRRQYKHAKTRLMLQRGDIRDKFKFDEQVQIQKRNADRAHSASGAASVCEVNLASL